MFYIINHFALKPPKTARILKMPAAYKFRLIYVSFAIIFYEGFKVDYVQLGHQDM